MRFLSVCSGIEAASVASKSCAKCAAEKPLEEFHRQPKGPSGRHSWCKECCNEYYRKSRSRNYSAEQKKRWQLASRYGLTVTQVDDMIKAQDGRCAICSMPSDKLVVDHCHETGSVRGMLCHGCNIKLPALDRKEWMEKALEYLKRHEIR